MKRTILKLAALVLSIAALFVVSNRGTEAARTVASQPAQEKTVEQTRKNIKVLTGLPDSQLIPVMNFFAASMGRRCNFCHVNNQGQWDYSSDAKPEKNTAREMIKMVLDINKTTARLNLDAASCYTCHRGRTSPQSIPTLPLPLPSLPPNAGGAAGQAPGSRPQASPSPTPALPSAEEIFTKYIAVIGGQANIDKIKSRTVTGTATQTNGGTIPFEISQAAPDKFHILATIGQGTAERGFNGTIGWEKTARGVRQLTAVEVAQLQGSIGLFHNIRLKEQFTRARVRGRDKIGDRQAYMIVGTTADNRQERLFFDAETGLLLRRITYTTTTIGMIPEQIDFEDYREVDGIKFPFTVRISSIEVGNPISTRTFTNIKLNAPVDDSKFNKPPEAKPANP